MRSRSSRGQENAYSFFAVKGDGGSNLAFTVLVGDAVCQPFLQLEPERSLDSELQRNAPDLGHHCDGCVRVSIVYPDNSR